MQTWVTRIARTSAIVGGLVLVAIIVLVCLSVGGRWLGLGEIPGTYEILEAGVGFAIFSFFPACQIYGGHATVDVFTSGLGARALAWLRAFWEVILSAVILFLSWRLYGGLERYLGNGETTLFLQFPVWWSYAASFAASLVACLTAIWCGYARLAEAVTGRAVMPDEAH